MPVFHTKTIESILEPVANQVTDQLFRATLFLNPPTNEKQQVFLPMSISKNNFLEKSDSYNFEKRSEKVLRRRRLCVVAAREDKTFRPLSWRLAFVLLQDEEKKVYINAKSQSYQHKVVGRQENEGKIPETTAWKKTIFWVLSNKQRFHIPRHEWARRIRHKSAKQRI